MTFRSVMFFLFLSSFLKALDGAGIVEDANSLIGQKYVWGGESFEEGGFDCSGLVYYIMQKRNVKMPRTAKEQAAKATNCPEVPSLSQVQIGDAIYFRSAKTGQIHHVAIVSGFDSDGTPIITHARDSNSGVVRQRMTPYYINGVAKIRRLSQCDGSQPPEDKVSAPDFLEQAYRDVTGMGQSADLAMRVAELTFSYKQPKCCCNPEINKIFQASTAKLMAETYPAIDLWVSSLRWIKTSNWNYRLMIKNLKVANGIWSFSDLIGSVPKSESPSTGSGEGSCNLHGCESLDWNKEEDRKKYEKVIDCMETSGKGDRYTEATSQSSAFGRYQFTKKTAAEYCRKAGGNCCATWKSAGSEGRACQDKMFEAFTRDNINSIPKSIPINTCTLYLAHQQGVGGLVWLQTGKMPKGYTFQRMKTNVVKNVGKEYAAKAEAASSEEELRQVYKEFWDKKFGGDILANVGAHGTLSDVLDSSEKFNAYAMRRILYYRKGILLQQRKLDRFHSMRERLSELIGSSLATDAEMSTVGKGAEKQKTRKGKGHGGQ